MKRVLVPKASLRHRLDKGVRDLEIRINGETGDITFTIFAEGEEGYSMDEISVFRAILAEIGMVFDFILNPPSGDERWN